MARRTYEDPVAATRAGVAEEHQVLIGVEVHGDLALVALGAPTDDELYPDVCVCHRKPDGRWRLGASMNGGFGTRDLYAFFAEVDPRARAAVVAYRGAEQRVPVTRGFLLYVVWEGTGGRDSRWVPPRIADLIF